MLAIRLQLLYPAIVTVLIRAHVGDPIQGKNCYLLTSIFWITVKCDNVFRHTERWHVQKKVAYIDSVLSQWLPHFIVENKVWIITRVTPTDILETEQQRMYQQHLATQTCNKANLFREIVKPWTVANKLQQFNIKVDRLIILYQTLL